MNIEKELQEPVKVLYDALLLPFEEEEHSGGRLNIYEITFGEFDANSPFQDRYREIKRTIQHIAHEACFYITMSVLFGDGSALHGNSSSVLSLKEYIANNSMKSDEDLIKEAHPLMKDVLDAMLERIVEITESTILFYFRYELDKLLEYYTYDGIPAGSNSAQTEEFPREGEFLKLLDDLKHELRKRAEDPEAERLQARLDELLYKDESQIEHWVQIIREIERVHKGEVEEEQVPIMRATTAALA